MNGAREVVVAVEGLTARFGETTILEKINLEVFGGEILCIVGGSGCGKSTLLKQMIGLLRPAAGRVVIGGIDIAVAGDDELNRIRKGIGVLF
ncbi:MAG: ATP-binding cassette domain-containing protein, partial [Proteobacteria bacterium]|nr:ATP-binding cassette domain-containing protein [Pseudomonadota bacterium]